MNYEISAHTCLKSFVDDYSKEHKITGDKYQVFSEEKMRKELDMMQELGIKWFNTSANNDVYSNNEDDKIMANKLYEYLKENENIKLSSLHYIGSVFELDEERTKDIREQMKRIIMLFAKCQPKTIVIHPGVFGEGGFKHNLPNYQKAVEVYGERKVKEMVADNIRYFGKLAGEYGIKIAVENIYKGRVYSNIPELIELVDMINLDNVGFCLDIGHANYDQVNIPETIRLMKDKLFELHVSDNLGDKDGHLPIGFGNINWSEACQILYEINYQGRATFEFFGWPGYDRKKGLELSINMWDTIQKIASDGYSYFDFL